MKLQHILLAGSLLLAGVNFAQAPTAQSHLGGTLAGRMGGHSQQQTFAGYSCVAQTTHPPAALQGV